MRIRNKATDILMIIGLTISFIVVLYGICIYNIALSKTDAEKTSFVNEYNFKLSMLSNENIDKDINDVANHIISVLDVNDGNVSVSKGGIVGQGILPFDGLMYIVMNESPKNKLAWGRYPNDEDFKQNAQVIVVNEGMINYATTKNGKYYLELYGDVYEIIGVIDDESSISNSCEMLMFYDCLGTKSKSVFCMDLYNNICHFGLNIKYESDRNISDQYADIIIRTEKNNMLVSSLEIPKNEKAKIDWFTILLLDLNATFSAVVFLLGIVNCCAISFLWIKHRMNEYAVRRAFGYSTKQLFVHVIKEFLPISLASVVFTGIIQFINIVIFKNYNLQVDNILPLGIAMFLSVALSMLIPFRIVSKVKPATGIKEL